MDSLNKFGWNEYFQKQLNDEKDGNLQPGRISSENKTNYSIQTLFGEITCEVSGRLMFTADDNSMLPKVGDWVLMNYFEDEKKGVIQKVLNRKSKLSRKSAGIKTEEQVIAANIDYVLVVHPIDSTFNKNKLERQLVVAYQSKAEPVLVLSKSDLCPDLNEIKKYLEELDVNHFMISALTGEGLSALRDNIEVGKTYVLLGSSGVGKSTLINKLYGEEILRTNEIREADSKGRHTTTRRDMIILPFGGILIDNPGIRELQLWNADNGLQNTFNEFGDIEAKCKYNDCTHVHEKGCAVLASLEKGEISEKRYKNYLKMRKELEYLKTKQEDPSAIIKKKKWKNIRKEIKRYYKDKNR